MRASRIAALVMGCLLLIPALALLFTGGALGVGYAVGRGDDGYFDTTLDRLITDTVAITADDITFAADPGSPDWVLDALDTDVRIRAANADANTDIFIGIARQSDLDVYLRGVAHDEVIELTGDLEAVVRERSGSNVIGPPSEQNFWAATATGPGTQQLDWEATSGRWAVVAMNADATPGVGVDVNIGVRAGFILPLALIMLSVGAVLSALAVVLIVVGARGARRSSQPVVPQVPPGAPVEVRVPAHPVQMTARLDPELSRWQWLVKWFLAIPHFVVLVFLWAAFVVLTLVAAVAIVFTGRYPRGIFDFNVGVLRWSWRVSYYATTGGIGSDRYPPFNLHPEPDDLATLDVTYATTLSRWLVFVKWLLAIPQLIIVALLVGTSIRWLAADGSRVAFDLTGGGGLLGVLVLVTGIVLLFTGRYPTALFDLIVGLNRWIYRTVAYVALMTDTYPPFRLDQGGNEPDPTGPTPTNPAARMMPPTASTAPLASEPSKNRQEVST